LALNTNPRFTDQITSRHSGGVINAVFCDGHTYALNANALDNDVFKHIVMPYDRGCAPTRDPPVGVFDPGEL
jgi:prepilin-type processing-associated H-X9-DG protein